MPATKPKADAKAKKSAGKKPEEVEKKKQELFLIDGNSLAYRAFFVPGVFGNIRLQYGEVSRAVYGAPLYPAFELEFRL